jgi:hypothetical protein
MIKQLETMTPSELVRLFNQVTGQSVKRFADRQQGFKRVVKLLAEPATKAKLEAALGLKGTTIEVVPADQPIPSVAEAFATMPEVVAAGTAEPAPAKPRRKVTKVAVAPAPKAKATKAPAKRASKAAATPMTLIKPIEGSKLVAAAGRVVRPENAKKVLAGQSLWGAVAAAPSDKDKLKGDNARLNLNYPIKTDKDGKPAVKPMREGTKRHKLVSMMRTKGVTVEDVMAMFQLTHDQAVYKLRDLHYMSGHGLEVRNGRVFVTDRG